MSKVKFEEDELNIIAMFEEETRECCGQAFL